jgi:hypothetical protein
LSRSCTRRERSNTPLQALTLLNDEVFIEAAQALAVRVLHQNRGSVAERIDHAFDLCLGRAPTPPERQRLTAYYQEQASILHQDPQAAAKLLPHRLKGIEAIEGGAWTGVCSVWLNLHEFITRD